MSILKREITNIAYIIKNIVYVIHFSLIFGEINLLKFRFLNEHLRSQHEEGFYKKHFMLPNT